MKSNGFSIQVNFGVEKYSGEIVKLIFPRSMKFALLEFLAKVMTIQ